MMLSKTALFSAALRTQLVTLPAGTVQVRELTSAQVVEFTRRQAKSPESAVYYLIVTAVHDDEGNALFVDNDIEQIKQLGASTTNKLVAAIMEVSGMTAASSGADEKKEN